MRAPRLSSVPTLPTTSPARARFHRVSPPHRPRPAAPRTGERSQSPPDAHEDSPRVGESTADPLRVGLISDTHGLLRDEVFSAFAGVDRILHAGDVGDPTILTALAGLAPVEAVWGNVDGWDVRTDVREVARGELNGRRFVLVHGHQVRGIPELSDRFAAADLIVYGHSHLPAVRRAGRILLVNPGSAGPRRFGKPVTVAVLEALPGRLRVEHLDLETGRPFRLPAEGTLEESPPDEGRA